MTMSVTRPNLDHCRTCSARLVNPVFGVDKQISSMSRLCYEIIERVNDLPALPEHLVLQANHESRVMKLVSKCTRNGGTWATTDVLTCNEDGEEWMWDGLAAIEEEDKGNHIEELQRPKWVERKAKPVQGLLLHRLPEERGFEVELLFEGERDKWLGHD